MQEAGNKHRVVDFVRDKPKIKIEIKGEIEGRDIDDSERAAQGPYFL